MNAVRVRWPSGRTQRAPDVVADSLLTVYENPRHLPTGEAFVAVPYRGTP